MATSKDVTYRGQWFDALAEESSSRLRGKFSEGCNLTGVHAWARHVVQDCRRSPEFLKEFSMVVSTCRENRRKRDLTDAEVESAKSVATVNTLLAELMCPDDIDIAHDDADNITLDNTSGIWGRTLRQAVRGRHTPALLIKRCEIMYKRPQGHMDLDLMYRDLNRVHQWLEHLHEEKHHNFWYLKTLTEIKLRQYESANTSFTQAKLTLDYSDLSPETRKMRRKKLARGEVTIKNGGGKNLEKPEPHGMPPEVPKLAGGHSEAIPNVSSKLELEGDFLAAREDINVGDVLMVEVPTFTAPCPATENETVHQCSHCLVPTEHVLPCPDCRYAMFCSVECKSEALKGYHGRGECSSGILGALMNWGDKSIGTSIVLSLRQLFSKPLSEIRKNKKLSPTDGDDEELEEWEIYEMSDDPFLCGKTALTVEMLILVLRSCEYWSAEGSSMLCKGVLPNCMLVFSGPNVVLVCFRPFGDDEYVTVHSKMTERLTVPAKNILCGDIEGPWMNLVLKTYDGTDRPGMMAALANLDNYLDNKDLSWDMMPVQITMARTVFLIVFNQTILDKDQNTFSISDYACSGR